MSIISQFENKISGSFRGENTISEMKVFTEWA